MALVDFPDSLFSLQQRGKFGAPGGLGNHRLGWTLLGYFNKLSGYYQKRKLKQGGKVCRLRHYWPKNPQTIAQQANRARFAQAVNAWRLLTPLEVAKYNKRGAKRNMEGFNLFISEYMKNP